MALIETLQDSFNSGSVDTAKWTNADSAHVTVTSNLLVELTSTLGGGYYGLYSVGQYDLTGSYIHSQLVDVGNQAITSLEVYPVSVSNGSNGLSIMITGNVVAARKKISGSSSTVGSTIAYNSTTMRYFRIRESGGVTYWEYATRPSAVWTRIASATNPIAVTSLSGEIIIGTWQSEASTTTVKVDSLNYFPLNVGINFAQDFNCYNDVNVCIRQLTILKSLGITKIRVNLPTYLTESQNASFRNQLRLVCTTALSMGFYVIWGYKASPLTAANQAAFKTELRTFTVWAKSVGLSEICVGNEEDLTSTLSASALRGVLQDVCQTIKVTDGFSGVVSTAITTNVYAAWAAEVATWSPYMKIDLHIYFAVGATGGASFENYAATVPAAIGAGNVYCGEFGVNGASGNGRMSSAFSSDTEWIKEIVRRAQLLEDNGWQSYYYFAYSIQGDTNEELRWSAYRVTDGQFTPLLESLARKRPRYISTS